MNAIKFRNFTNREFVWKWDGIEHVFPAGMEIFLEDYKAYHFAKHLVDEELNHLRLMTNNIQKRQELMKLCFPSEEVITSSEALNINAKSDIKVEKEVKKEVEFEELKRPRGRPRKHE